MLILVLRLCVTLVSVLLRCFSNTLFYFLFMDWNPTAHLNKNTQNCVELSAVNIQNFWLLPLFNNVANKCLYVYVTVFKGDHDIINYQARWPLQGFQKGRVFVLHKPFCLTKSLKRNRSRQKVNNRVWSYWITQWAARLMPDMIFCQKHDFRHKEPLGKVSLHSEPDYLSLSVLSSIKKVSNIRSRQ